MTLYEIDNQIRNAIEFGCDPETGEIIDGSALEQLQMDRDIKLENLCLVYKNLCAESAAIKAEEDALAKRRKSKDSHAEWVKKYIQESLNGEKFETARCATKYTKSQSVEVDDLALIPAEYLRIKTDADKAAIKKVLKGGGEVAGAHLEDHQNMTIK